MRTQQAKREKRSKGDARIIEEAVDTHIERYLGDISFVLHEEDSPLVHVDVYLVGATPERPYHCLLTSGMSEKPMPVPKGAGGRYAGLVICLPPEWPLTMEAWNDEANWWPIRLLKGLARYPHENKTWLYADHSILWSDPPQPFASSTRMTSVLLLRPKLIPPDAQVIHVRKNGHIQLWGVYPLHHEELELKQRQGSSGIETLFEENGITELLDPQRLSVARLQ